jgi:hypothetical protein
MSERKSGKQRRAEIQRKRLERAQKLEEASKRPDVRFNSSGQREPGVEPANREILSRHNNTYGPLPERYLDRAFMCRDCGEQQVWTAKQQKWWYEVAHGHIDSVAVRCLPCRRKQRAAARAPGSNLLRETCDRIRALGESPPNAAAWDEIETALSSKWLGVRSVAIATLGRWGDARAVAYLKAMAEDAENTRRWGDWRYERRSIAIKALSECIPESEMAWVLDNEGTGALYPRIANQSVASLDAIIAEEWRRDDPVRLQRLMWILSHARAGTEQALRWRDRFRRHPRHVVRQEADRAWRDLPA